MEGEQRQGKGMDERDDERETLAVEDEDMAKAADADADGSNNPENLTQSDIDLLEQTAIASRSLRRRAQHRSRFVEHNSKNRRSFPKIQSPIIQRPIINEENSLVDRKKNIKKYSKMHMEALQNVRNTIAIAAVLIATVAFSGCTNPPGGFYQDGPLIGKPTLGRATAFKVFVVSNDVAMFLSLSIVLVLVSIIPFKRKPLMRLLAVIHKVMCVAVLFMITAYIAARWVTMDRTQDGGWMFAALVTVCGGLLAALFVGLTSLLVHEKLKKLEKKSGQRKSTEEVKIEIRSMSQSFSSVSDITDFIDKGYHSH
ncbi:hypothetical protein Nepgr_024216 [Nepenthes gracilis]|uniref:PGG domain-containing protein n=1 Tax=Nepenthes gracilis TaxID=150966 RepID=A0AAD3T3L0_NEPGR|nr:hypothetical protein Nepgr_024216 [Nepenthes gracilis]